jgi:hypothetical protein
MLLLPEPHLYCNKKTRGLGGGDTYHRSISSHQRPHCWVYWPWISDSSAVVGQQCTCLVSMWFHIPHSSCGHRPAYCWQNWSIVQSQCLLLTNLINSTDIVLEKYKMFSLCFLKYERHKENCFDSCLRASYLHHAGYLTVVKCHLMKEKMICVFGNEM